MPGVPNCGADMEDTRKVLLKEYLSNLKVEVTEADYTKVWSGWRDMDYVPCYNKFYFICDGEGWLKIGGEEYYPKPGQLYLMPEGVRQSYSAISSNTFTKYWCHFTAKIGELNLFDVVKVQNLIEVRDFCLIEDLFRKMIYSKRSGNITSVLRTNAAILDLISYFLENSAVETADLTKTESLERLKIITDYIEKNLRENISIDELAQVVHLHPNYLISFFRKHLGMTPIHYINKRRIEEAKRLIIASGSDETLSDLSSKVGINDIYYFSKLFKEYTGFTPTQFKRMVSSHPRAFPQGNA